MYAACAYVRMRASQFGRETGFQKRKLYLPELAVGASTTAAFYEFPSHKVCGFCIDVIAKIGRHMPFVDLKKMSAISLKDEFHALPPSLALVKLRLPACGHEETPLWSRIDSFGRLKSLKEQS